MNEVPVLIDLQPCTAVKRGARKSPAAKVVWVSPAAAAFTAAPTTGAPAWVDRSTRPFTYAVAEPSAIGRPSSTLAGSAAPVLPAAV